MQHTDLHPSSPLLARSRPLFESLYKDPFYRMRSPLRACSYAIVVESEEGTPLHSLQYSPPTSIEKKGYPIMDWQPLSNVAYMGPYRPYKARSIEGCTLIEVRSLRIQFDSQDGQNWHGRILYFSKDTDKKTSLPLSARATILSESTAILRDPLIPRDEKLSPSLQKESPKHNELKGGQERFLRQPPLRISTPFSSTSSSTCTATQASSIQPPRSPPISLPSSPPHPFYFKGGTVMTIDNPSVVVKSATSKRKGSQKKVMKCSAKEAFEDFFKKRALGDPFLGERDPAQSYLFEMEWLHLYGAGLTPLDRNPQRRENLGASFAWLNTEMTVAEKILQSLALLSESEQLDPPMEMSITPYCALYRGSDVIANLLFESSAHYMGRRCKIVQYLSTDAAPIERNSADVAMGFAAVLGLLSEGDSRHSLLLSHVQLPSPSPFFKEFHLAMKPSWSFEFFQALSVLKNPVLYKPECVQWLSTRVAQGKDEPMFADKLQEQEIFMGDPSLSVFQIQVTYLEYHFTKPYQEPVRSAAIGTAVWVHIPGLSIQNRLLTCEHVVEGAIQIDVHDRSGQHIGEASVLHSNGYCDLALLEVAFSHRWCGARPLAIGRAEGLLSKEFSLLGYYSLEGADAMSIPGAEDRSESSCGLERYDDSVESSGKECLRESRGEISSIMISSGIWSQPLLRYSLQVHSNCGGSGGPMLDGRDVVGIVCSKRTGVVGGCEIHLETEVIATPVVQKFLGFSDRGAAKKRGFPVLDWQWQVISNPLQRKCYSMPEGLGVRVSFAGESEKYGIRSGDILLQLNGKDISDKGCIWERDFGWLNMSHEISMVPLRHKVPIEILRDGIGKTVYLPLKNKWGFNDLVPKRFGVEQPEYRLCGGFVISPLTERLMRDSKNAELYRAFAGKKKEHIGQEVVVITEVLGSAITEGYEDMVFEVIESVNTQPVRNFESFWHLMDLIEEGSAVTLQLKSGKEIVYFSDATEQANIMSAHEIESLGFIQSKPERSAVTLESIAVAPILFRGGADGGLKRPRTSSFKEAR